MTILLVLLGTVAGLILFNAFCGLLNRVYKPKHPFNRDSLRTLLTALLHQGEDGWLLFMRRTTGPEFLQFRKYIRAPGHPGIELGFPDSSWSREYVERIRELLEEQDLKYVVVPTGAEPTTAFILVDFGRDVERAREFSLAAVSRIFRVGEEEIQCHFEGRFDARPSARVGF
jgi:hypothetical protein